MPIPKLTGVETEYGISASGEPDADPLQACVRLFNSGLEIDFVPRSDHPYDLMLGNGARMYIDHSHPEYSSAEAVDLREIIAADKAGDRILTKMAEKCGLSGGYPVIRLFKNNIDYQGNSYGRHENYLLGAETFKSLTIERHPRYVGLLAAFLATRPLIGGSGRVGAEKWADSAGFQLSQRADFIETLIGPQTTYHRPLINTRNEPHADPKRFARLHIICGDAGMAESSAFLKIGATQLILMMIEDNAISEGLEFDDPVSAMKTVSRDIKFNQRLTMRCGRKERAAAVQRRFLESAKAYVHGGNHVGEFRDVLLLWENVLESIDTDWRRLGDTLDWAVKRTVLERYIRDRDTDWEEIEAWGRIFESPCSEPPAGPIRNQGLNSEDFEKQREIYFTLRRLDLAYHEITPSPYGCIYDRLVQKRAVKRILTDREIDEKVYRPPASTRARTRGRTISRFKKRITEIDWEEIVLSLETQGVVRLDLSNPLVPGANLKNTPFHPDGPYPL